MNTAQAAHKFSDHKLNITINKYLTIINNPYSLACRLSKSFAGNSHVRHVANLHRKSAVKSTV